MTAVGVMWDVASFVVIAAVVVASLGLLYFVGWVRGYRHAERGAWDCATGATMTHNVESDGGLVFTAKVASITYEWSWTAQEAWALWHEWAAHQSRAGGRKRGGETPTAS